MWGLEIAVMLLMVAINSVLAAYEIALASVSLPRLLLLRDEGRGGAAAAVAMKESIESSLAVVQLGITLVGAIAAAVGGAGAEEKLSPWLESFGLSPYLANVLAIAIVVAPLTAVSIVLGELVPKVFALRNKEWICLQLSPAMRGLAICSFPAVWALEMATSMILRAAETILGQGAATSPAELHLQELRASTALARASRLIGPREERIILSAARFSSRPIREIVLPAVHINMFALDDSLSDCLVSAHLDLHTRFPVTSRRGDPQAIVGYVNFKDIVAALRISPGNPSLSGILRPLSWFPHDLSIAACLERMIHEHVHIALVRDADQAVIGMVTLEDITEELLGDIGDEHDRLPTQVVQSQAGWIVGGGVPMRRIAELTGLPSGAIPPEQESLSLAAWMTAELGRPVNAGEEFEQAGLRIVVRKIRRQQVQEAQVRRKQVKVGGEKEGE